MGTQRRIVRIFAATVLAAALIAVGIGPAAAAEPSGLLVTPTALEFGEVQVGETSPNQQVVITNTGTAAVSPNFAGGAPSDTQFRGVQNCAGVELAPGESCRFTYRFEPTETGPVTSTTTISINGTNHTIKFSGTGVTPVVTVDFDIKPDSEPNCVNPTSKGRVPAAVLATPDFDPADIVVATIALGGVSPVHHASEDVNGDGLSDLLLGFKTPELADAGLLTDGNQLVLTGELADGTPVEGADEVALAPGPNC